MKMAIAAAVTATKNLALLPCIRYIHIYLFRTSMVFCLVFSLVLFPLFFFVFVASRS
jgi:hypothetical protein